MTEEEMDDDELPVDLRDAGDIFSDEWRRRTWYGKIHLSWEVPAMLLLLTLISVLKAAVYGMERIETNWPSKYKEVDDATE